jgi:hypothetical protein
VKDDLGLKLKQLAGEFCNGNGRSRVRDSLYGCGKISRVLTAMKDHHAVAGGNEKADNRRPNESRSANEQDSHA